MPPTYATQLHPHARTHTPHLQGTNKEAHPPAGPSLGSSRAPGTPQCLRWSGSGPGHQHAWSAAAPLGGAGAGRGAAIRWRHGRARGRAQPGAAGRLETYIQGACHLQARGGGEAAAGGGTASVARGALTGVQGRRPSRCAPPPVHLYCGVRVEALHHCKAVARVHAAVQPQEADLGGGRGAAGRDGEWRVGGGRGEGQGMGRSLEAAG